MSSTTCVKFVSEMPTPACGRKLGVAEMRRADIILVHDSFHIVVPFKGGSLPVYY